MKRAILTAILTLAFVATLPSAGLSGDKKKQGGSARTQYMIELKHTPEQCLADLEKFSDETPKVLEQVQWGCKAGEHTGYLIVPARNEQDARKMLPETREGEVRVVPVSKFTVAEIRQAHQAKK